MRILQKTAAIFSFFLLILCAHADRSAYDPGPNLNSENEFERKMAKELVDILAEIPDAPALSEQIVGRQRFRPAYGPIPLRMILKPNSIKILFIGQDGTHIAEAANRPATAGFGGRAQDMAAYFGVSESAAFINAFAFTINGQYSSANTPYFEKTPQGYKAGKAGFVDNHFWLLSQDPQSAVTQWRNRLIDWILRNNPESLRMIVAFGGAAKDAISSFVVAGGGRVGTRLEKTIHKIQIAEMNLENAGGNGQFSVLSNINGNDLFQSVENARAESEGRRAKRLDYSEEEDQQDTFRALQNDLSSYWSQMVFTQGGPLKNGLVHPAQLGGFDIEKIRIGDDETETMSLKGLKLSDGTSLSHHVMIAQFPHPTALSMAQMDYEQAVKKRREIERLRAEAQRSGQPLPPLNKIPSNASEIVANFLSGLKRFITERAPDWTIEADRSLDSRGRPRVNQFAQGLAYTYGREDIPPDFYDFGTPASRMVSVSSAVRMGRYRSRLEGLGEEEAEIERKREAKSKITSFGQVIVFGAREDEGFSDLESLDKITEMTHFLPAQKPSTAELYTARPRSLESRYVFDSGPGPEYALLLKEDFRETYRLKDGTEWDAENRGQQDLPISSFNIKSHPINGDFGHYRGTFKSPRVIVLADPHGYDDLITSRALTGERGQYLQGLMNDLGVGDQYLVIKTLPFGMDEATEEEWAQALLTTANYRKKLFDKIQSELRPELYIADGPYATKELEHLLSESQIKIISIARNSESKNSGITPAGMQIVNEIPAFARKEIRGLRSNIPRSHLPFFSRVWEGTSGDSVITASGRWKGIAFAEVAPRWAWEKYELLRDERVREQRRQALAESLSVSERKSVEEVLKKLEVPGEELPRPRDTLLDFLRRRPVSPLPLAA